MTYSPTVSPFPDTPLPDDAGLTDCAFPDRLNLLWHDEPPSEGSGNWQLLSDFRFVCRLPGATNFHVITAPRGMFTDLASIPQALWDVQGFAPFGPHLSASIIHDYLYLCWTDFAVEPQRHHFDFANRVFFAGMAIKGVRVRRAMYNAVQVFGWPLFKDNEPFQPRMEQWERML